MSHHGQVITRLAKSAMAQHSIAAVGDEPGSVTVATGANTPIGVCIQPGESVAGDSVDICESGIAEVLCGGAIAAGDIVGADATGRAVKVTSGVALGIALTAGTEGDIAEVRIVPHLTGAATASA